MPSWLCAEFAIYVLSCPTIEPEMFLPSTIFGHMVYCNHVVSSLDDNNNIKKVYNPRGWCL